MDLTLDRALNLLAEFDRTWAVCGGWAIDLFLDRKTREHKDLDITVKRADQLHMQAFLLEHDWHLQKVSKGMLIEWQTGEYLELPIHNVWCNHPDFPLNYLEVLFSEVSETHYKFRRNPQIQCPLEQAFLTSLSGVPILAPEIVLLFKGKYSDEKPDYQQDFELTLPLLSDAQCTWLKQALQTEYGAHSWIDRLNTE